VAIGGDGQLIAMKINEGGRNHAATINLLIENLLATAGLKFIDLSGVVVCAGPGSYTGLRIGMATAKGLCYALDIPLFLHNRLTLLAYQSWKVNLHEFDSYASLLLAREKEYFFAVYDNNFNCIINPQHIVEKQYNELISDFSRVFLITDVVDSEINKLSVNIAKSDKNITIDVKMWVYYSFICFTEGKAENLFLSEPFYLKQVYTHN
jgi:tRNA threonylcarbamoyladenosine biosynthesis protein TsaB